MGVGFIDEVELGVGVGAEECGGGVSIRMKTAPALETRMKSKIIPNHLFLICSQPVRDY